MVWHTLRAFVHTPGITSVEVIVSPHDTHMAALLQDHAADWCAVPVHAVPVGGATRAASVLAGLRHLRSQGAAMDHWVMVHDAARCLVTPAQILALMRACAQDPVGALLAVPLADTLKSEHAQRATATLDRANKWLAQTPQQFRLGALLDALSAQESNGFAGITDEASAMEQQGQTARLVQADALNFKVTYPADFDLAEIVIAMRKKEHA